MRTWKQFFRVSLAATGVMVLAASVASVAGTPEQMCQKGRYGAAAKYAQCQHRAMGKFFGGGDYPAKCSIPQLR